MSEPGFKKWYVTECSTSDCWCRCIGTAPDSDDMQDYIVPSGSIHRADAEQVVAEHNERPDLLKTIAELRRELAEAQQKIAVMQSLCDSTSGLYKYFEAEAGRLRERVHEATELRECLGEMVKMLPAYIPADVFDGRISALFDQARRISSAAADASGEVNDA